MEDCRVVYVIKLVGGTFSFPLYPWVVDALIHRGCLCKVWNYCPNEFWVYAGVVPINRDRHFTFIIER